MYIDTHAHIQFSHFDLDRPMVIGNAKKAGVKQIIVPGVDMRSSTDAVLLASKHPHEIFAAIGFHQYEAQKITPEIALQKLKELLLSSRDHIVAIGECGLDYHLYKDEQAVSKKSIQKELFLTQLQLATANSLPIIMHVRDAYEDIFNVYDSIPNPPTGVIHCFSGGLQEMRLAKERGLFIGIDGNVTYSKTIQRIVSEIPLSMMLLETDTPYLTPVPHRGERNEPKFIPLIATCIGELIHTTPETVMIETTKNAKRLFQMV